MGKAVASGKAKREQQEQNSRILGNWSQRATAAIAALALIGAFFQVRNNASYNREADARKLFQAHVKLEFDHPELISSIFGKDEGTASRRYAFVTHLLFTCEEILETTSGDLEWRSTCKYRIENQIRYICANKSDESLGRYSESIRHLVSEVMAEAKEGPKRKDAPECEGRNPLK